MIAYVLCLAGIVTLYAQVAPIVAVRGNVDDDAPLHDYPNYSLLHEAGWSILLTHVVGKPPNGEACAAIPHVVAYYLSLAVHAGSDDTVPELTNKHCKEWVVTHLYLYS